MGGRDGVLRGVSGWESRPSAGDLPGITRSSAGAVFRGKLPLSYPNKPSVTRHAEPRMCGLPEPIVRRTVAPEASPIRTRSIRSERARPDMALFQHTVP